MRHLCPPISRATRIGPSAKSTPGSARRTYNTIPGGITRGAFTPPDSGCILDQRVSTFNTHWFVEFDPKKTKPEQFHVRGGAPKYTQTMQVKGGFGFQDGDGFSAISARYAGEEFQLLILLPKSPEGLPALEQRLTGDDLTKLAKLNLEKIRLHLPRFRFNSGAGSLAAKLRILGLKTVFNDPPGSANFSKIAAPSPDAALRLSDVIHETTLTVNEQGTIAAAITEIHGTLGAPGELWINRPFFFAVQHIPTGACILLGHVVDPRENPTR